MNHTFRPLYSFPNVLVLASLIRIGLILYSEWHDARSAVKYTDIDYRVFSDAARFVLHPSFQNKAQGPLSNWFQGLGNPYTRETYRYTPLLAVFLTPNEWLHASFGKYLFAACDIVNGCLMYRMLVSFVLKVDRASELASLYSAMYLLNPMVFSISTRGSSESVLALFVLLTLYFALAQRWNWAAVLLGFSTHWKIYPAIYGFSCLAVVGSGGQSYLRTLVNARTIRFGLVSVATFFILSGGCYLIWGYPFLYESYLYHLHRLDHRHNFSPYFYLTYLTYPILGEPIQTLSMWSTILRSPLVSFVPQMTLAVGTGLVFGRRKEDLVFAWYVQTTVFVVFNKVCTSQYFLWYLLLLPLLLPQLNISRTMGTIYVAVYIAVQALWLSEAYQLEFRGQTVFFGLWIRGLVYVVGNCWVLAGIIDGYGTASIK
ncbi:glycosyltransferase family 50 protein [Mycena floridula]|nr:glycosyltransferase family 50 protein [Mycena floridula]